MINIDPAFNFSAFKPFAVVQGVELVSYPWPERNGKFFINARTTPGDPTTMKRFEVVAGGKLELREE